MSDRLAQKIATGFDNAISAKQIHLYHTAAQETHLDGGESHTVYICPELQLKPPMPTATPDLISPPKFDPLAGPTFGAGELIEDLGTHWLLNNKYSVMRGEFHHLMKKRILANED
jgi:hypothetical protein